MEMPLYKVPALGLVLRRMLESGWAFLRRAGTIILASMIVVWALLYFPVHDADGRSYDQRIAALEEQLEDAKEHKRTEEVEQLDDQVNELRKQWKDQSYLGRAGQLIE